MSGVGDSSLQRLEGPSTPSGRSGDSGKLQEFRRKADVERQLYVNDPTRQQPPKIDRVSPHRDNPRREPLRFKDKEWLRAQPPETRQWFIQQTEDTKRWLLTLVPPKDTMDVLCKQDPRTIATQAKIWDHMNTIQKNYSKQAGTLVKNLDNRIDECGNLMQDYLERNKSSEARETILANLHEKQGALCDDLEKSLRTLAEKKALKYMEPEGPQTKESVRNAEESSSQTASEILPDCPESSSGTLHETSAVSEKKHINTTKDLEKNVENLNDTTRLEQDLTDLETEKGKNIKTKNQIVRFLIKNNPGFTTFSELQNDLEGKKKKMREDIDKLTQNMKGFLSDTIKEIERHDIRIEVDFSLFTSELSAKQLVNAKQYTDCSESFSSLMEDYKKSRESHEEKEDTVMNNIKSFTSEKDPESLIKSFHEINVAYTKTHTLLKESMSALEALYNYDLALVNKISSIDRKITRANQEMDNIRKRIEEAK
jgi:hypothetical protein